MPAAVGVHVLRRLTAPVERNAKEHQPAFLACMGLQRGVGNPCLSGYRFRILAVAVVNPLVETTVIGCVPVFAHYTGLVAV